MNDLICPVTELPLQLVQRMLHIGLEIISGQLQADGRSYDVIDGVPVMLAPDTFLPGQSETLASFADKWKMVPDYRAATRDHYIAWYLEGYGFKTIDRLRDFLRTKHRILDAETGLGRDADLFAHNTAGAVYAIDASSSVFQVYWDVMTCENLNVVQADLARLPFPQRFFDFISSDQVLHHTPDTRKSLNMLLGSSWPEDTSRSMFTKRRHPFENFVMITSVSLLVKCQRKNVFGSARVSLAWARPCPI